MVTGLLTIELTNSCFPSMRGKLRLSIRLDLHKQIWQQNETFQSTKRLIVRTSRVFDIKELKKLTL